MNAESTPSASPSASEAPKSNTKRRSRETQNSDVHSEPLLKKPRFATPPSINSSTVPSQAADPNQKSKKRFIYKFGNYAGYYGYRLNEAGYDPRIDLLEEQWFKGKRVLDIGCNSGVLSIRLAKKFNVEALHGIDIDKSLIDKAKKNLASVSKAIGAESSMTTTAKQKFHGGGKLTWFPASSSSDGPASTDEKMTTMTESHNPSITFEVANYVRGNTQPNSYDTILCLSVIKWIHLNWGDAGIRILLLKVHRELRDDGLFILEIQPLSSYKKVKNLTPHFKSIYASLEIKPDQIVEIAEQLGLKHIHTIQPPQKLGKKDTVGFSRPIHVFQKGPVPKRTSKSNEDSALQSHAPLN